MQDVVVSTKGDDYSEYETAKSSLIIYLLTTIIV